MSKEESKIDTWTRTLDELLAHIRRARVRADADELMRLFDNNSALEIRIACVERLSDSSSPKVHRWFLHKIDQFAKASNYETVYALLENGLRCVGIQKKVLAKLITFVQEQTYSRPIQELTLLLCGWIIRKPDLYNRAVRAYFREFILANPTSTYGGINEEASKTLREMLRAIGAVEDTSFLPLLEGEMSEEDFDNLFKYVTIHKELIAVHGARLVLVQYLEQIKTRKSTRRKTRAA